MSQKPSLKLSRRDSADGASLVNLPKVSKTGTKNSSSIIMERLPSFIPIVAQLTEINLSQISAMQLNNISSNPALLKALPLRNNVDKLLEKMPSIWKKVIYSTTS